MKEFGARDRLVMAGLVILGLLTVIAGVVSGRSTINYVLSRDAREAALNWAAQLDQGLKQLQPNASELLGRPLQVLRETALATEASTPAVLPGNSSLKGEFNLIETLDSLTTGWLLGHGSDGQTKFASELSGYAVLAGDRAPLAVGGDLTPAALDSVLTQSDVNADLALYRAKEDGRSTFRFFEPAMDAALQKRRRLENDLRNALRKNQLYLDYQPQFDLVTGKLSGYEALVRWWHPSEGEISPSKFIPIAEETGLIVPLGEWILKTACAYATTWPADTKLAVNLSPAQFKTQNVYELVRRVLTETGLEPERLELEITETTILQNTEAVLETLNRLDQLGVSIAMDDFGTGYSSLSYLARLPVKKIKIDRSFIDTLGTSEQTSAIVSSIVGLGQSLHVTITAEGVENESQAEILRKWGCNQVQGFYYGRPDPEVPESEEALASQPRVA